jgi:hypothetical protein
LGDRPQVLTDRPDADRVANVPLQLDPTPVWERLEPVDRRVLIDAHHAGSALLERRERAVGGGAALGGMTVGL